ncbi:ABC transporter substrate-binding protein [Dictyobacter aurantiacus]|uniref:ABC transporter substrate-binding protein n=1 Tax=Dictyobacter aurantiacus TaxID=1936993 RepID=A0A401ZLU6_9CHLR|nr:sugar ABC transporter substrate-binding protein [Dictyobacter aurantiacus]GCE07859.1 ABC transporter substrate-binding protein [Dictyobacter aurantiacus]
MRHDHMHDLVSSLQARKISRREFTTRSLALGLSTAAIGSLLAACGDDGSSTKASNNNASGQITVWTWPDNDKTFAKTVPIFQKKFPTIKVNVQAFANADTDYATKLLAAIVSGTGPDVAMVEIGVVAKFKGKPGFVDLSQAPYNASQYKGSYAPYSWDYVANQQTGKVFALPKNTGPGGLFYRRDLFQKAGLPSEPDQVSTLLKDWDAFLSVGKKMTIKGKQWMIVGPSAIFQTIIAEAGFSYYDTKGNLQLDNPTFKTAMQYTKDAWQAGIVSPLEEGSAEANATTQNGTVAVYLSGNWFGGLLKSVYAPGTSGKWGVTTAPAFQGKTAYDSGGDFIGILESSQNKQAAWNFVKFVTQDPDSLKTMYLANDLYPAWTPALSQSWLNESDAFYKGQQVNQVFSQVQQKMAPPIANPNDAIVGTVVTSMLTDITRGNMAIDAAISKAKQQIQAKTGQ